MRANEIVWWDEFITSERKALNFWGKITATKGQQMAKERWACFNFRNFKEIVQENTNNDEERIEREINKFIEKGNKFQKI